jgi:hypothetical protein
MRSTKWMTALFFAALLGTGYAMAADSVQPAPASETGRLETISDAPAATAPDMKDCPVHHGKKECPMDHARQDFKHKHGEPCPHHQDAMHQGKSHEKCDHEQRS